MYHYRAFLDKHGCIDVRLQIAFHFNLLNQSNAYPASITPPSHLCSMLVCIIGEANLSLILRFAATTSSHSGSVVFLLCVCVASFTLSTSLWTSNQLHLVPPVRVLSGLQDRTPLHSFLSRSSFRDTFRYSMSGPYVYAVHVNSAGSASVNSQLKVYTVSFYFTVSFLS